LTNGEYIITWSDENGEGYMDYPVEEVERYIQDGSWLLVD
jgi:hypothetical protein